jgi:hypothetical protein
MSRSTTAKATIAFTLISLMAAAGFTGQKNPGKSLKTFEGMVTGIDVTVRSSKPTICLAFISPGTKDEIQVRTEIHSLQTVLELASSKKVRVEVYYEESGEEKTLTRVRLLDR